jgi:sugar phosphate isomerase/epimerase
MKVGVEICHGFIEDLGYDDFVTAYDRVKAFGLAGMYYKSTQNISKTLDPGRLRAARQYADQLGLYLEFGLGRVNPYNTSEAPDVWLLGGGDYRLSMEKLIAAAAEIGCHELLGVTAGWKYNFTGYYHFDRFRTDVTWKDQLLATQKFLKVLAPVLRQYGSRVNLETHEEITSYEILRIIEAVGSDVVGVALDTGNILSRGEDPVAAAKRVAPYCHQTHAKDAILFFSDKGIVRQVKPCGSGVVNWREVLPILYASNPGLTLNMEDHKGYMEIDFFSEEWRSAHPDLKLAEMGELIRLARQCEMKISRGEIQKVLEYEAIPYKDQMNERLKSGMNYLNGLIKELKLE